MSVAHPQAWPGKGTLLQHGVGTSPVVWTTVAQRVEIDGPDGEFGTRDTSHLDSVAKTKGGTILDPGDTSMTILYDPGETTHTLLQTLYLAGTVEQWQLVHTDVITSGVAAGSTLAFSGILNKFKPTGMKIEDNLQAECNIAGSGLPVFTKVS